MPFFDYDIELTITETAIPADVADVQDFGEKDPWHNEDRPLVVDLSANTEQTGGGLKLDHDRADAFVFLNTGPGSGNGATTGSTPTPEIKEYLSSTSRFSGATASAIG